MTISWQCCLLF